MENSLYIVDDEEDILKSLFIWFNKPGYKVKTFSNAKDLLVVCNDHKPDLILLDINLDGEDGRDICKFIKDKLHFEAPVLLFSANPHNGKIINITRQMVLFASPLLYQKSRNLLLRILHISSF